MESIHILALAMLVGCIVVIDLRLMRVLMRGWTVAGLTRELTPYFNWSLVIILITGVLLFLSEAAKAYENAAFWFKLYALTAALVFHFTAVRRVTRSDEVALASGRTIGLVSLLLWIGVGWAGRAIGFV